MATPSLANDDARLSAPLLTPFITTASARSNRFSVHEVHVDAEQLAFFREQLEKVGRCGGGAAR